MYSKNIRSNQRTHTLANCCKNQVCYFSYREAYTVCHYNFLAQCAKVKLIEKTTSISCVIVISTSHNT